ncbi:MAG: nitroreductase family protein [Rikenellaceae bacterium]
MKKYTKWFNIILIIVLLLIIGIMAKDSKRHNTPQHEVVLENIFARHSVREYIDKSVTKGMLDTLARAGMAAPTGMGREAWAFILIDKREVLDSLASGLSNAQMLFQAAAAIVVCGNTNKAPMEVDSSYWVQECSAATENILLASQTMGLGAVWTGAWPRKERMDHIRKTLNLPPNLIPLNVISLGYPQREEPPKDKYKSENIFWNKL